MRLHMAQTSTDVERRAGDEGWNVAKSMNKRRMIHYPTCASGFCIARVNQEGEVCPSCKTSQTGVETGVAKGEFRGYSKNTIGDRSVRQAKRRAWGQSRKNKSKRTANRYKRAKIRGSGSGARPKMRRQLGAGGKRVSRSR